MQLKVWFLSPFRALARGRLCLLVVGNLNRLDGTPGASSSWGGAYTDPLRGWIPLRFRVYAGFRIRDLGRRFRFLSSPVFELLSRVGVVLMELLVAAMRSEVGFQLSGLLTEQIY